MTDIRNFLQEAEVKAFDANHRKKLNFNISKYAQTVEKGLHQYTDLATAKKRAKNIKWKALANLDSYLLEFEKNFEANGGNVIWARDGEEALTEILQIAKKVKARSVVKSKSMATEEIELNQALEEQDIKVFETDLGEYIVQLAGEKPYHIVTPAMHKSKEDVQQLFNEKLGTAPDASPQELTLAARAMLRSKYLEADIGVTGANFLIANTGSIAITENEGNARLTVAYPKIHIAIVGIEKMIPTMQDLELYWPLLATFGTGQKVTVFNTILSGPKKETETDGPEEMYVILLDNHRSDLLAEIEQREALYCIRCGACLNFCPVYKNIGGHTYGTTYSGPIGSVITPHLKGMANYIHLSQASTLCGKCTEICPVGINIHNMLLANRRQAVERGVVSGREKRGWKWWRRGMMNRKLMNMPGQKTKMKMMNMLFRKSWGNRKEMPEFPYKSFNKLWIERQPK